MDQKNKINLMPGDIFLSKNPMFLGRAINAVQSFWAVDRKSIYSHAGIITSATGTTLEALWTVKEQNIHDAYKGTRVLIARHKKTTHDTFLSGYKAIKKHQGQIYPAHRLILHLIPPLSRFIHAGRLVCSELTWKFLRKSGLEKTGWYGQTPDTIHDYVVNHRDWCIVFEGVIDDGI
jgi:hypothetical protein